MLLRKGAMFGLVSRRSRQGFSQYRTLKKQFGKLFLVRMQSVGSQETRRARIQSNRAAMFGLDARIALAIFGALSVISGAALYSAIQQARVVSIIQIMNEIGKAYEQYVLDTGIGMPDESSSVTHASAQELVENTVGATGWSGPYLPYEKILTRSLKMTNNGLNYAFFMRAGIDDWASADGADKPCDGSRACYLWVSIRLDDNSDLALVNALDEYVDGGDGLNTGKFRHQNYISLLIGKSYKNTQN